MKKFMAKKILFVCIGNSCRSQIAEGISKKMFKGNYIVESAGISPAGFVADNTKKVLEENNIPSDTLYSKGFEGVSFDMADYLVILDSSIDCNAFPSKKCVKWDIPDPIGYPIEFYRKVFSTLYDKIQTLLKSLKEENDD